MQPNKQPVIEQDQPLQSNGDGVIVDGLIPGKHFLSRAFMPKIWKLTELRVARARPEELQEALTRYDTRSQFPASAFLLPVIGMYILTIRLGFLTAILIAVPIVLVSIVIRYLYIKRRPKSLIMSHYAWYFYESDPEFRKQVVQQGELGVTGKTIFLAVLIVIITFVILVVILMVDANKSGESPGQKEAAAAIKDSDDSGMSTADPIATPGSHELAMEFSSLPEGWSLTTTQAEDPFSEYTTVLTGPNDTKAIFDYIEAGGRGSGCLDVDLDAFTTHGQGCSTYEILERKQLSASLTINGKQVRFYAVKVKFTDYEGITSYFIDIINDQLLAKRFIYQNGSIAYDLDKSDKRIIGDTGMYTGRLNGKYYPESFSVEPAGQSEAYFDQPDTAQLYLLLQNLQFK